MIVCSWNVRGLGGRIKKRKVRELIGRNMVDVLAIQETKLEVVDKKLVTRLWGCEEVDWRFSSSRGRSGGVLIMWNSAKGCYIDSFQGSGYLGVILEWGLKKEKCLLLNVYAPCNIHLKKVLWVDLLVALQVYTAEFKCVLGDFNSIRSLDERKGVGTGNDASEDSRLFNIFIENSGLIDLPLMGRKFTWVQPSGRCMSRLDRVLVSQNWLGEWGNVSLWGQKRDVSDHCPILIKYDGYDWGPKPFRFNNHWLKNNAFSKIVEDAWDSCKVKGRMGFVLKEKFKFVKEALKKWNKEVYGSVDKKIEDLTKDIETLELKGEEVGLSEAECVLRKDYFSRLWMLLKSKDSLDFQRSRSRWLKEGDANTSFFHACIKSRKRSNTITALKKRSSWVSKPVEVRAEVVGYFREHFQEVDWQRPTLDGLIFPTLEEGQREDLEANFLEEELAAVIVDSDGNKSPGPDGFNFNFFKKFWGILKKELLIFF
jgi:exonuclease III